MLAQLLGRKLKDHEVLEVLESYGIEEVVYDFDRHEENVPDVYWAAARPHGFLLRFDEGQSLDTVFCYVVPDEGFSAVDPALIGAPVLATYEAAEAEARRRGARYRTSDAGKDPGLWLRIDDDAVRTHYQFRRGALVRVTLMTPDAAP